MVQEYLRITEVTFVNVSGRHKVDRYFKKKNGEPFWAELTTSPVRDETGKVIYFISLWIDVTERRKAEEQLKYQAMLVDNISDAVISTTVDARIISWNKAAERTYGWKQEEVADKNINEVLHPSNYEGGDLTSLLRQLDKPGFWVGESVHTRRDGVKLDIFSSICRVMDSSRENLSV